MGVVVPRCRRVGKKGGKRNNKRSRRLEAVSWPAAGGRHNKLASVAVAVAVGGTPSLSLLLGSAQHSVGKTMVLRRSEDSLA